MVKVIAHRKDKLPSSQWQSHLAAIGQSLHDMSLPPERRFRMALALAFHSDEVQWDKPQLQLITDELLKSNPMHLAIWTELLSFKNVRLIEPLAEAFADAARSSEQHHRAASLLAKFASSDPELLASIILRARMSDFEILYSPLAQHDQACSRLMLDVLQQNPSSETREERRLRFSLQSNAALVLMRLGLTDSVWPLLKHSSDPSLRTLLIQRFRETGVELRCLVDRFSDESELSTKRALLLAIGEYKPSDLSDTKREALMSDVGELFRDSPDPGLHSACEWLMRQWDQPIPELTSDDASLESVFGGDRDWFVNSQGQTLAVFRGPVNAILGSPDDEPNREWIEQLHSVEINRSYAIGLKAITVEQYQRFNPTGGEPTLTRLGPHYPACMMDFFEAARYCRWLSEQEGIPEDQMCYPPEKQIKEGFLPIPDYLSRSGYRLPSEAELEWSIRAGASTQFCFGDFEEQLGSYAWYIHNADFRPKPPGLLKPNDFGLFDAHGNIREWGQEWISHSSLEGKSVKLQSVDMEDLTRIVNVGHYRIARSGSFQDFPFSCRSAHRDKMPPLSRATSVGIRLARTIGRNSYK